MLVSQFLKYEGVAPPLLNTSKVLSIEEPGRAINHDLAVNVV